MRQRFLLLITLVFCTLAVARAQDTHDAAECANEPYGYVTRCGYVTLPQDYAAPGRGLMQIYYAQIHSNNPLKQPDPLVYLVGGPGSSGSHLLLTSFKRLPERFRARPRYHRH